MVVSVATLNTNSLRLTQKQRALFAKIRKSHTDFFMLQETHSTTNDEKIWKSEWGGEAVFSHGRSNSRGVSILLPRGSEFSITRVIKDDDGRYLIAQLHKEEEEITLVNIYASTSNDPVRQETLLDRVYKILADLEIHTLIIGGDINVQLDPQDPSSNNNSSQTPGRELYPNQIKALLEDYNLVDVWKRMYGRNFS